jgi:hypothetical protein
MNTICPVALLLGNEAATLDDSGWALIAPFGEHPKSRIVKKNGRLAEEKFIQVLDNESADQLLSRENSLFRRIRRAMVGIPVYKGHPDLRDYAPETAGSSVKKEIIGTIDRVRKTGRGIEAHFVLTPEGADAVEKEGCKYPSALWFVLPIGRRGDATLARPFKLLSAGLTAHPNIPGVESLANAGGSPGGDDGLQGRHGLDQNKEHRTSGALVVSGRGLAVASSPQLFPPRHGGEGVGGEPNVDSAEIQAGCQEEFPRRDAGGGGRDDRDARENSADKNKEDKMKLIAGWLIAQGAALANSESPTETQVLVALQKLHSAKTGEMTLLGNEKSTLAGENEQLKSEISRLSSASAALENERADLSAQMAVLKSGRATAVVDLAIARGKLNVAERTGKIEALGNAADFEKESSALLASATRYRTAASAESGKVLSNQGTEADAREEYCAAVERHMKETGETDPIKAHQAVMQRNPGLAEKLQSRSQSQS